MHFDYLNVLVFSFAGLVLVLATLFVAQVIRPARTGDEGLETYECGEQAIGNAWIRFDIRYYTVALVYLVFAVEIAFLFPWALVLREAIAGVGVAAGKGIGLFALVEGFLFVAILFLGLVYVWVKGDLDWVLSYSGATWQPKERAARVKLRKVHEIEAEREVAAEADKVAAAADEDEAVPAPEPTA